MSKQVTAILRSLIDGNPESLSRWLLVSTALHFPLRPLFGTYVIGVEPGSAAAALFLLIWFLLQGLHYGSILLALRYLAARLEFPKSPRARAAAFTALILLTLAQVIWTTNLWLRCVGVMLVLLATMVTLTPDLLGSNFGLRWALVVLWGGSVSCAAQSSFCTAIDRLPLVRGFELIGNRLDAFGFLSWVMMFLALAIRRGRGLPRAIHWWPIMMRAGLLALVLQQLFMLESLEIRRPLVGLWTGGEPPRSHLLLAAFLIGLCSLPAWNSSGHESRRLRSLALIGLAGWGWSTPWQQLLAVVGWLEWQSSRDAEVEA